MIYTAETVNKWHPDKICDQISDAIVDACLEQDPLSRVAVETIGGHGVVVVTGEITTKAIIGIPMIIKNVYFDLVKKDIGVLTNLVSQSPDISQGVDDGGAGDQGIMVGYACKDNPSGIPAELYLARKILEPFDTDGKSQVTIEDNKLTQVVLSVQGKTQKELYEYVDSFFARLLPEATMPSVYCNNTGAFEIGGFDADTGCTGRKIVVDAYGPRIPVGGGAFSGKDPTKVDRSGAYMARWIAVKCLEEYGGEEALVKLAYVIGKDQPVMQVALVDGKPVDITKYDCRPKAIIERFNLGRPIYLETAKYGSFGRDYPWEQV